MPGDLTLVVVALISTVGVIAAALILAWPQSSPPGSSPEVAPGSVKVIREKQWAGKADGSRGRHISLNSSGSLGTPAEDSRRRAAACRAGLDFWRGKPHEGCAS